MAGGPERFAALCGCSDSRAVWISFSSIPAPFSACSTLPIAALLASEANNAAMGKVLQALKGAGIEEKDIQTARLSLQPQSAANRSGPPAIAGYRASNRVTIRVR